MLFFLLLIELIDDDIEFFLKVLHLSAQLDVALQGRSELLAEFFIFSLNFQYLYRYKFVSFERNFLLPFTITRRM